MPHTLKTLHENKTRVMFETCIIFGFMNLLFGTDIVLKMNIKKLLETLYQVSQKKVPTFENSWHQEYFSDLNDSKTS